MSGYGYTTVDAKNEDDALDIINNDEEKKYFHEFLRNMNMDMDIADVSLVDDVIMRAKS